MESHARPPTKHPFSHGSTKANSGVRPGIGSDQEEARLAGETVSNGVEVDNKAAGANRRGRRGPPKEDTDEVSDDVLPVARAVPRRGANHRESSRSKPPRGPPPPAVQDGGPRPRRRRAPGPRRRGARCASRFSNRGGGVLRGRCGRWAALSPCRFLRPPPLGSAVVKRYALEHLQHRPSRRTSRHGRDGAPFAAVTRPARKRRVGIVENHYCAKPEESRPCGTGTAGSGGGAGGGGCGGGGGGGGRGLAGGGTVCEIVHGLERLLGEESARRRPAAKVAHANGLTMRSKSPTREQELLRGTEEGLDPSEANERYDEFDTIKMPVVRSLSKSPQSDEGIEPDTAADRRRASVARCWSLDSAAASDDDVSLQGQHQKRHKLRVTRCYSSDSAVLSDEDQARGWDSTNMVESGETESNEGRPRYWRTPSVVVSDYSDYSYLDEKLERSDLDLEKYDGTSGTPSQASSCSCLDCDELRESLDNQLLQVCRHRRHSDSCCLSVESSNATSIRNFNETGNRRNSCLDSAGPYYSKFDSQFPRYSQNTELPDKGKIEFLNIPPTRKISDCSTNSSLSGDECDLTELQRVKPRSSGWRKLRNIVHWTPFFQTYKKQRYPWVQLAGHQGNFRAGPTPGTILKKLCPQEEACFRLLMNDVLRPYVPEFKGVLDVRETEEGNAEETENREEIQKEGDADASVKRTIVSSYLQLQDLLGDFEHPCVMDCKVGVRTYLESELAKAKERPKLRKDMYEKMVQVDPSAPSAEERRVQGVTKPRYMVWRETISSTATLGFRVEGIKLAHGGSSKDFKTTRTREQVTEALSRFVESYPHAVPKYLQRLKAIRATLKASPFFASHEVVGSSLLFVHDAKNAGVWMIDFAKSLPLPQHLPRIQHDAEWQVGNHEDGYLIGVNNLIDIFQDIRNAET